MYTTQNILYYMFRCNLRHSYRYNYLHNRFGKYSHTPMNILSCNYQNKILYSHLNNQYSHHHRKKCYDMYHYRNLHKFLGNYLYNYSYSAHIHLKAHLKSNSEIKVQLLAQSEKVISF
ncbi:hypothetical protein [Paraprevotella clara]|jgi:hypothetical protein|uniref:hypothetical protein n=1 Tax=Paraprevotella clara TaxID=454154 RepID=UPI002670AD26|nr:hypothetical protein [Paraprevotella clara]MEE0574305.1 hypothetical protein [Paraprevotella clara]